MAYCAAADILLELSTYTVAELTDDVNGKVTVDAVVTRCIANADTEINSYIRGKQTIDGTDVILRKRSVDIAIYYLYARRMPANMPESVTARYEAAISWLKAIRDNKVVIDDSAASGNTGAYMKVSKTSSDLVFTDTVLDGYK